MIVDLYLKKKVKESTMPIINSTFQTVMNTDRIIQPVHLEISRNLDISKDVCHFHRRRDFHKIYKKALRGDVDLIKIFDVAQEEAENTLGIIHPNFELFKNMVGISGVAGIGKTLISKVFTKMVYDKKTLLERELVFYIPLRAVNNDYETTLFQFLIKNSGIDWEHNELRDRVLLNFLLSTKGEIMLLVFDGLDEIKESNDWSKPYSTLLPHDKAKAHDFIINIFSGKLFPKAKKLITSRPKQLAELNSRPDMHLFLLEVKGLSEKAQEDLAKQICGEEGYKNVALFLQEHLDILVLCHVAVNLILIVSCVHKSLVEGSDLKIRSMTGVLVYALYFYVKSEHVSEVERLSLTNLAKLAWDGIANRKVVFDEFDFKKYDVKLSQAFLHAHIGDEFLSNVKIIEGELRFSFCHLIWQEFFSSCHHMFCMSLTEFKESLDKMQDPEWEIVSKFSFGFFDTQLAKKVGIIFSGKPIDPEKIRLLKEFAAKVAENCKNNRSKVFDVLTWANESHDRSIISSVSQNLPNVLNFSNQTFFPSDSSNLAFLLRNSDRSFSLKFQRATIVDEGKSLPILFASISSNCTRMVRMLY